MEYCLLCLESPKTLFDCIQVNSELWDEQGIQFLIEKHMWPMKTISSSSWMCLECVQKLQEFHEFYRCIELAHQNFSVIVKTEDEKRIGYKEKDDESNYEYKECPIEPEMEMEQPIHHDCGINVTSIKTENVNADITEGKIVAMEDPLETRGSGKIKPLSKETNQSGNKAKKMISSQKNSTHFDNVIKPDSEVSEPSLIIEKSTSSKITDNEDNTDCSENDEKKSVKTNKRKKADEKTLKKYDRIIAENFQLECCICKIPFANFIALRRHFKVVHEQSGYARCCNRNLFSRTDLVDHIQVHCNPEYFKCQECCKVFSNRSTLKSHIKFHEDHSKLLKCDQCGKVFVKLTVLRNHLLTHSSEKTFPCTICGKFYTNSSVLNHHIEAVHQNKFVQVCEFCGKSLSCPTAFASHMEKHEVYATPISCEVCGLLLSNKMGLNRHKNSQHPVGGKSQHKCHICTKISPTLRALKSHIHHTHKSGYDYKCSLCEKAFKKTVSLKEHMATHTGTTLYNCPWCSKTFISKGNMYKHRKNAHPKEWEELKRQKYVVTLTT